METNNPDLSQNEVVTTSVLNEVDIINAPNAYLIQMVMITWHPTALLISLSAMGDAKIDWGDGSARQPVLTSNEGSLYHKFSDSAPVHAITITGNNVKHLVCNSMGITALDVGWNYKLTYLNCSGNKLIFLDLASCDLKILYCQYNSLTELSLGHTQNIQYLDCSHNKLTFLSLGMNSNIKSINLEDNLFTDFYLNSLFDSLPYNNTSSLYAINIKSNPGASTCKIEKAIKKRWSVIS